MNKKIPLGAAIAFMIVVAGITFCITMIVSLNHFNTLVLNVKEREEMFKKLADVDRESRQNFAGKINETHLSDAISAGYVRGLGDKYSAYLTRDEYEEKLLEQKGQRVSIGLTIEKDQTGYMLVKKVTPFSPAEENGLMAEDLLISVDGKDLKTVSLSAAERLLKGQVGTKVSIAYRRDGVDETIRVQRAALPMQFVESTLIETNGYIKITDFNDQTFPQFKSSVDQLIKQGAEALIFDVRGNNSDSIEAANAALDILLPGGELGSRLLKDGTMKTSGNSDQYEIDLPMSVIINGKTGCAAEYFAASLNSFHGVKKASIVGTQSIGKSAIQELLPLTDGSAISLTTAYILTPDGDNIGGVGVKPDYEVKLSSEQEQAFETLTPETDPQIKKAIEIVNSKKLK